MNQHKRKMQNKYKHKFLLAAAVASFSVFGVASAQSNAPKAPAKGSSQARAKSAAGMEGGSVADKQTTQKGASYAFGNSTVGPSFQDFALLGKGHAKDLPGVRYATTAVAAQPPADAKGTINAPELLASGYNKDLPSVRYQTVLRDEPESGQS